ncbi:unnamed protein product, partial [Dicrocoelium dendriticum]
MGSPLGPVLADIFLAKLETESLGPLIDCFDHYYRYMDDIFCITHKDISLEDILAEFNGAHPAIKFTYELEQDGQLSFLDVHLSRRTDGSILRKTNRKKTWTGQYTNFSSFVPLKYKRNLVHCLTSRARKICSEDALEDEMKSIQNTLRENGYPERFIQRNMQPKITP